MDLVTEMNPRRHELVGAVHAEVEARVAFHGAKIKQALYARANLRIWKVCRTMRAMLLNSI